jgi:hypothetical protein
MGDGEPNNLDTFMTICPACCLFMQWFAIVVYLFLYYLIPPFAIVLTVHTPAEVVNGTPL